MSNIIAGTTASNGLTHTSDTSGALVFKTNDTGSGGTTALTLGTNQQAVLPQAINMSSSFAFRNRIINGTMAIDQINSGASMSGAGQVVDRWTTQNLATSATFTTQQLTTSPPAGFQYYVRVTTGTADASPAAGAINIFYQPIEGWMVQDFDLGRSSAKTFTLSFWVRSSLTGTFSAGVTNSSELRGYTFTYPINVANTWEYKTVNIPGDVSGTWLTGISVGLYLFMDLGSGSTYELTAGSWVTSSTATVRVPSSVRVISTASATWDITGVQLEPGAVATPFEQRNYQDELNLCLRYYWKSNTTSTQHPSIIGNSAFAGWYVGGNFNFPVPMRTTPTISVVGTYLNYNFTSAAVPWVSSPYGFTAYIVSTGAGPCYWYPDTGCWITADARI